MKGPHELEIRIDVTDPYGNKINLSIAELGVFLTGINRGFNRTVMGPEPGERWPEYFPAAREPQVVRMDVVEIRNGSVLMTVAATVSDFAGRHILEASFLASILANAAYDLTKVLGKALVAAVRRVSIGDEDKDVTVTVTDRRDKVQVQLKVKVRGKKVLFEADSPPLRPPPTSKVKPRNRKR